jgi:hypothetical protein
MHGTQHNFQEGLILRSPSTIKKDVIPADCVSNNDLWDVVHYQSVEGGSSRKWVRTGAPQHHHNTVFFIQLNTKLQVTKTSF